jgi:multidrug efflux system membrane fusion protein
MQKVHDMTTISEPHTTADAPLNRTNDGKPITRKPPKKVRWFLIVGIIMAILIGGLIGFKIFINGFIAKILSAPRPPIAVTVAEAKTEVIPNLQTAVGDLAAVHQVNVTSDVNGRITEIFFTPGTKVKKGAPLVQLFDGPDQGDLANFKAQATGAQLALDRAKQLAARQFGPQATVDSAQALFDQATAGIKKTEATISQKLVRAPFDGVLGVRRVEVGQYLTAGTLIVTLTDLSDIYVNFTATEKQSALLQVGQVVRIAVDAYPGRNFQGKITTIEPQISSDTRNIRIQATIANPDEILKPGMFATTTIVLPDKPSVVTLPETAVDYTLYGDSVYLIKEAKDQDGKTNLTVERTFVKTGDRVEGRVVMLSGVKPGDRVVAVGQLKLQSGAAVTISSDPPPQVPAQAPLN